LATQSSSSSATTAAVAQQQRQYKFSLKINDCFGPLSLSLSLSHAIICFFAAYTFRLLSSGEAQDGLLHFPGEEGGSEGVQKCSTEALKTNKEKKVSIFKF